MWSRQAAVLLCVATALVLGAPPPAAAQVGPLTDDVPRQGTATFTDLTGGGACSLLGEPPDNLHVGLSSVEFAGAAACGGYADVTGPDGRTVRVAITDHCINCPPGLLDLSRTGFAAIADPALGRVPVSYRLVRNPSQVGTISLRVKESSSRWWAQIQVLDHGNPLAHVELDNGTGWRSLVRSPDNHWTAADPGPGDGPFALRITDVFGQSVTIPGVALLPGEVQPTRARLYPASPVVTTSPPTTTTSVGTQSNRDRDNRASVRTSGSGSRSTSSSSGRDTSSGEGGSLVPLFAVLGLLLVVLRLVTLRRRRWA